MRLGVLARPRRRRLAGIAVCALVALFFAVWNVDTISLRPPGLAPRDLQLAGAETHLLIDRQTSTVTDHNADGTDFDSLNRRASLLANMLTGESVRSDAARHMGIDPALVGGVAPITLDVPIALTSPDSERRATDIQLSTYPYRLDAESRQVSPMIDLYTRAPTVALAERLADEAVASLRRQVDAMTAQSGLDLAHELKIEQLGPARGAVLTSHMRPVIALLTFVVSFAILLGLLLVATRARRGWALAKRREAEGASEPLETPAPAPIPAPAPAPAARPVGGRLRLPAVGFAPAMALPHGGSIGLRAPLSRAGWGYGLRAGARRAAVRGGDWPRTTRVLPWMIAGFIVMLWLVPFNSIELTFSTPIDMHLDRLVLPFIVGVWLLAMAAGGPGAPRIRLTWIHAGVGAFVAVAFLSVAIDARYLNETLELVLALKKLTLLVTYGVVFLIVASVVRRSEIQAFLKLMLACSAICAVGIIIEYRFHTNLFYIWSDKLLPSIFQVDLVNSSHVDEIGRPEVVGPAQLGLEAVGMLTMGLPIGLVGLLQTESRRTRILYGLAVVLLLAAAISTYRKSAFIAPIMVVVTIAYFRRRELLKLSPLGLVSLVAIHFLSPGAFGSVFLQLNGKNLNVDTVNDRTADYDAVRPDLWSHMAFGRGFGSYDHTSYRILDSEILTRLVEMGIVGLVFYFLMFVSIVAVARGTIRSRHPEWAPVALIGAAAAVGFATLSALYDVLTFPHAPYLVLVLAAIVAVAVKPPPEEENVP
jgi:hypothetical protein